jgi:hypothetical protein
MTTELDPKQAKLQEWHTAMEAAAAAYGEVIHL